MELENPQQMLTLAEKVLRGKDIYQYIVTKCLPPNHLLITKEETVSV